MSDSSAVARAPPQRKGPVGSSGAVRCAPPRPAAAAGALFRRSQRGSGLLVPVRLLAGLPAGQQGFWAVAVATRTLTTAAVLSQAEVDGG